MSTLKYADIRPWLSIGNREICTEEKFKQSACIHIYREDMPHYTCPFADHKEDYRFAYKDGEGLDNSSLQILKEEILGLVESCNHLIVHCHAGQTRSPLIGLFVLTIIENKHPFELLPDLYKNIWQGYHVMPNISLTPLIDIVNWFEQGK